MANGRPVFSDSIRRLLDCFTDCKRMSNTALQKELQKLEEASGGDAGGGNDAAVARSIAVAEAQSALLQLKVWRPNVSD